MPFTALPSSSLVIRNAIDPCSGFPVATKRSQAVTTGELLLTIESMKIEHRIGAPRDATVSGVTVVAGQQLVPGQVLLVFGEENP